MRKQTVQEERNFPSVRHPHCHRIASFTSSASASANSASDAAPETSADTPESRRQIGGSLAFLELQELQLMRFFPTIAQPDRRLTGRQLLGTIEPVFPGSECGNTRLWRRGGR